MLPYFPRTYPDELLYSVLARYHRHTCSRSAAQTLGDLFGDHYVRATLDLPGHLGALSARLPPDRELTAERLALDFTLFPYWTAFQPAGVSALSLASLINESASRAHTCLGIVPSGVHLSRPLRFCPTCNAEAVARWGECFWRRAHQLPGVLVCPTHGTPLAEYAGLLELGSRHEFFAATAETCPANTPPPPWADDEECRSLLQEIAQRSAALLTARPNAETFETLTARYRRGLPELGLATTSRHIDHRHLHDAFAAVFKPVSTILPAAAETKWLDKIVHKHRHAFHPLHHILFEIFLERHRPIPASEPFGQGPWYCINPLAEHCGQAVITDLSIYTKNGGEVGCFTCACGYIYTVRPGPMSHPHTRNFGPLFDERLRALVAAGSALNATAHALNVNTSTVRFHAEKLGIAVPWRPLSHREAKESPGSTIRERWLDAQLQHPNIARTALSERFPAEHRWLYNHDRAWLDAHSPPLAPRPQAKPKVAWGEIDRELAAALRRAAEEILREIPPKQVTLAELERRVGRPGWIGGRRAKLPETTTALAELIESVEGVQLRRLDQVTGELRSAGIKLSIWNLRRRVGLPTRATPAVEQALRTASRPKPGNRLAWP